MLRHLPIVSEAIDRLGIHQTIDRLFPQDGRMQVSDAHCADLMIHNILQGRVALYKMDEWLAGTDVEVVLGPGCPPEAFYDDRLASTLDRLFAYGIDDVLTEVVTGYLRSSHCPEEYRVHTDTTSISLEGAYETPPKPGAPRPAHGHSKDMRPDLKQLIYGMSLQGPMGVPLVVSMLDGNTSDQAVNRLHIDRLAGLLPPEHDITLVHDCKLFDPVTLGLVVDSAFHFVTLVPRSYNLCQDLVEWATTAQAELAELARDEGRTSSDPDHVYRGLSRTAPFEVEGPDTGKQTVALRFLVVESSQLAAAFDAGLDEALAKDRAAAELAVRKLAKAGFGCEQDATDAVSRLRGSKFHAATLRIRVDVQTLRRPRRGRPRAGEAPPTRTVYRPELLSLQVDPALVEHARRHARCFVLATDHVDAERWPDTRILAEYRHQHLVEGHTGFRWLKGPAKVAPMFLKTSSRIAALGVVFILALMVRNYVQWALRQQLEQRDEALPNMNNQPTKTPTTESAFRLFTPVSVILVEVGGRVVQRLLHGFNEHAKHVLDLLNVPLAVYVQPRLRAAAAENG
jgi:transposase